MLNFRDATEQDISQIADIYNEAVLHTTATFDTEIKSIENRLEWLRNRTTDFPVIMAQKNGQTAGYAALNRWSERKAYDITAEISIYLIPEFRNMGIGSQLLQVMMERARQTNLVSVIARITEGNEHSVYLHTKNGFQTIGVMKKAGRKFNRLLDVTLLQCMLKHI